MSDTPEGLPNPNPTPVEEGPHVNAEEAKPLDPASIAAHYEQDDVDVRSLVRFGVGIAVAAAFISVVLWLVMSLWTDELLIPYPQLMPADVVAPEAPGPGLDAVPELTLERVLQRDRVRLTTFGWVDRENGVVHIPIEEAMRMMLERGVPARDGEAPDFGLDESYQLDSSGGISPYADFGVDVQAAGEPAADEQADGELASDEQAEDAQAEDEQTEDE